MPQNNNAIIVRNRTKGTPNGRSIVFDMTSQQKSISFNISEDFLHQFIRLIVIFLRLVSRLIILIPFSRLTYNYDQYMENKNRFRFPNENNILIVYSLIKVSFDLCNCLLMFSVFRKHKKYVSILFRRCLLIKSQHCSEESCDSSQINS